MLNQDEIWRSSYEADTDGAKMIVVPEGKSGIRKFFFIPGLLLRRWHLEKFSSLFLPASL
jgi:hypothetical protein